MIHFQVSGLRLQPATGGIPGDEVSAEDGVHEFLRVEGP